MSRAAGGGETAVVAGFGVDGITASSAALRAGALTITRVTPTQIEAAYNSTTSSVCSGDSGGPLLVSQDGVWSVAGVTSGVTLGCLSGTSYYANVSNPSVKDFILKYVPGAVQR
jgi:secreted trypsin-like serine protease